MKASLTTPAKVNLYLRVTGKREDGYHNIETVFLPLYGRMDEITLEETGVDGIELQSDSREIPLGSDNLCWRAADRFAAASGITPAWRFTIVKNIPVSAGLGGGSSDAAAVLRLLNSRFNCILSETELKEIAIGLGSDVPFFLNPAPAVARGRGEQLQPFTCKTAIPLLIINPGVPISAAWAYRNRVPCEFAGSAGRLCEALADGEKVEDISSMVHNDLEAGVERKFLIIPVIKNFLSQHGCSVSCVSGSGSTVLGLFTSTEDAAKACKAAEEGFGSAFSVWKEVCNAAQGY